MGLAAALVVSCSDDPVFFLINSYTTGLAPSVLSYMLGLEVRQRYHGRVSGDEVGLPVGALTLFTLRTAGDGRNVIGSMCLRQGMTIRSMSMSWLDATEL